MDFKIRDLIEIIDPEVMLSVVGTNGVGEENHNFFEGFKGEIPHYLKPERVRELVYLPPINYPKEGKKTLLIRV